MIRNLGILATFLVLFYACKESSNTEEVVNNAPEVVELVMEKEGIILTGSILETKFEDAKLNLISTVAGPDSDTGNHLFRFEVENYELGVNTSDVLSGQCANSGKGQHIHYIMNNAPYSAYYEAEFEQNIPVGHNVLLAFLSRSYHMSVKEESSFVLTEFNNGDAEDDFDETAPHLFYSRPKGEYVDADAERVMLDFFLVNTDLEDMEYSVQASINGVDFKITKWMPYFIEGLVEGENTIRLELMDENDNPVDSPFNPVERIVSIKYSEESI